MECLNKYIWIDIIKYIHYKNFKNYALTNKNTLNMAKEYISYKKREFKSHNKTKTYKNCFYRLKTTNTNNPTRRIINHIDNLCYEFIILIKHLRKEENNRKRINYIVLSDSKEYCSIHSPIAKVLPSRVHPSSPFRHLKTLNNVCKCFTTPYPGVSIINDLSEENLICFY